MKRNLAIIGLMMLLLIPGLLSAADEYPARPITVIIGYTPGGVVDLTARALSEGAGKILKQPIIALNKPGGSTIIATTALKGSTPDGYTIGVLTTGTVTSPLVQSVPYDLLRDFIPISQYGGGNHGLVVRADSPWKTFKEFFEYAKANPGKIKYGTSGALTSQNLVMEQMAIENNIKWKGIHYPGGAQAHFALLGGHIDAVPQLAESREHIKSGELRFLASLMEKRTPEFPDVPTLLELGYHYVAVSVFGIMAPKGVPEPIVQKLEIAYREAMNDEAFLKIAEKMGLPIQYRSRKDFAVYLKTTSDNFSNVIKKAGLDKRGKKK
jgi:tripartite-type tricarboxylate transporter receptor subunit TctC